MIGKRITASTAIALFLVGTISFANSLALFRTNLGDMVVELFDEDKPITVHNFIRLSESSLYSQPPFHTIFHRLEPGFVLQGGGYVVPGDKVSTSFMGFPPFDVFNFGSIPSEYDTGTTYDNVFGTIAMARIGTNLNSATSQWFFNLGDNTSALGTNNVNGPYTVFGRVIRGSNILHELNAKSFSTGIVNMTHFWGTNSVSLDFRNLPVTFTNGNFYPRFNELIYPGIDIFQVFMIMQPDNTREILWNSPSGLVCRLEYSETFEDAWNTLFVTNGSGTVQTFIDTNTVANYRKYRVRVE